jgi:hypothetical protein
MKIAQGKAAEAAALGKTPPHPASFFVRNPGRRFACPGLLSYHPSGISVWLAALA